MKFIIMVLFKNTEEMVLMKRTEGNILGFLRIVVITLLFLGFIAGTAGASFKIDSSNNWQQSTIVNMTSNWSDSGELTIMSPESDEFDNGTLDRNKWYWERENVSNWFISPTPDLTLGGYLRINSTNSNLNNTIATNPMLLQNVSNENWTIIVRGQGNPSHNYDGAGIMIWGNDSNFLKYVYYYCPCFASPNRGFQIYNDTSNVSIYTQKVAPTLTNYTFYMKVIKNGINYSTYYSTNRTTWTYLSTNISTINPFKIGLTALDHNGGSPVREPFNFSYFMTDGFTRPANTTHWYNATAGSIVSDININATTPENTNYTVTVYNTSGATVNESIGQTGNWTNSSINSQNVSLYITWYGNQTNTPSLSSIEFVTTSSSATLDSIVVSPSSASLSVGGTQAFNATAFNDTTPMPGVNVSWTVINATVGSVSSSYGITDAYGNVTVTFTASEAGTTSVNATNGTINGSASVTVTAIPLTLTSIVVSPSSASLSVSETQAFNATAFNDTTPMPGVNVSWTVTNATVGSVPASSYGLTDEFGNVTVTFTASEAGTTSVNATNGTINGSASVTVTAIPLLTLTSIVVSPSSATLNVSETQAFNATALNGSSTPMPGVNVSWTVTNATVGSVSSSSGITDAYGNVTVTFTASEAGTTSVNATNGIINGSASVTVNPAPVRNVSLTNISVLEKTTTTLVNATYLLNLTNTGDSDDTYTITVNGTATVAAVDFMSVNLSAGASKILSLNVTNATVDVLYINVTATSLDDNKTASVNTTTIVHSLPPEMVTSYWGTVKILGNATPNAVVRIYDANSVEIANATSNSNSLYLIQVPWDNLGIEGDEGAISGEILTFKVNGSIAATRVVDAKGTNTHFNLSVVDNKPPAITISFPGNNTNISIFDRIITGSITDDSAITNASLFVDSIFKKSWASKGNFIVLNNFTEGIRNITISAKDEYDNYNLSSIFVNVLSPVFEETVNVTAGSSYTLTANANTGTEVELLAGNFAVVGTVTINASINADDFNASSITNGLGRYVDINATNLTGNLSSVKLTMFYNHSDLDKNLNGVITDAGDINEATLNLYWYWDNATATGGRSWLPLTAGVNYSSKLDSMGKPGPVVMASPELNKTANYLSVTLNHFSMYTIAGTVIPTPPSGCVINCGGGGGSGGGGGGGKSAENQSNIELIEKYDLQISKDALTSYRFTHAKNPIIYVNITGNTSLGIITASIEVLKNISTLVNFPPEGLVYRSANIWVGTTGFATPKNIKDAFIKFRVDNEWMSAKGVLASDIVLMKWDGKAWIELDTKALSKDNTYSYFEGWTNSFSPFAIVAKAGDSQPTPTATSTPAGTSTPGPTGKPGTGDAGGFPSWIIGLIILVIIGAGAYYFMVVKKKAAEKEDENNNSNSDLDERIK
ncbi:hypothetical protein METP3_01938 [Methanosarcinales archaeon]|nr:hypothetical protein METP3_01938 [Methanosarcinales archaeon]